MGKHWSEERKALEQALIADLGNGAPAAYEWLINRLCADERERVLEMLLADGVINELIRDQVRAEMKES